jgi:hypothetical protein
LPFWAKEMEKTRNLLEIPVFVILDEIAKSPQTIEPD